MRATTTPSEPTSGAPRRGDQPLWRSRWAAIGAAIAVTLGAGGLVSVRAATPQSVFVAVTPQRVLDTRAGIGLTGALVGGQARTLDVTGTVPVVLPGNTKGSAVVVPDGATAVVANVTAVRPTSTGFVSVRPGSATGAPTTSNINITTPGGVYPNSVTVELPTAGSAAGRVNLYYFADSPGGTTQLLFDIVGYYVEGTGTGPAGPAGPTGARGPAGRDGVRIGPPIASTVVSDGDVGAESSITIGTNGNPIISYLDRTNGDLEVAACTDRTCTSATITTLDSVVTVGQYSSIAIGANGNPVISYYSRRTDAVATRDLKFVACTNPTCTTFASPVFLDTSGNVGEFTSLAIGQDGNPIISYHDEDTDDVKVVACTNPTCTTANPPVTLVSDGEAIPRSIVVGADGNPLVTYWERLSDTSWVIACTNPTCTAANSPVELGAGSAGSMVIGAEGNPVIAFTDGGDLKAVACTVPDCTTRNPAVTLHSAGTTSTASSITVGASGNPLILLYDFTSGAMKVAACEDARCGSAITATLSTPGVPVFDGSMTIGADGNPIISFYDPTPKDLRVWACGNTMCNPYIKVGR